MNNSLTLQKLATSIVDKAEELQKLTQDFAILSQKVKSIDSEQETEVRWSNSQGDFTEESLLEAIAAFESKLLEYQNHSVD